MTADTCPRCGTAIGGGDKFCRECGSAHGHMAKTPSPTPAIFAEGAAVVPIPVDPRALRHVHRRKSSRTRRIVKRSLLAVAAVLVLISGYAGYRVWDTMSQLHSLSEPPPEVAAEVLGGTPGAMVDTGPALTAVATYKGRERTNWTQPVSTIVADKGGNHSAVIPQSFMNEGSVARLAQNEVTSAPAAMTEVPDTVQTFLLMGVDARPGEAIDVGVRPDTLAVAAYDTATNTCRLLSIQPESRVDLPGYGQSRINNALAVGGIPYQQMVVEQFLGIHIDHYALIDFTGVTAVVDKIGGVDIVITDDPFTFEGYAFEPGEAHLDGTQALAFARYRLGPDGDLGSARRQQQIISSAVNKLSTQSTSNLAKLIPSTMDELTDHVRTDLGIGDLTDLGTSVVQHCSGGGGSDETIEGTVTTDHDPLVDADLSYLTVTDTERDQKVQWLVTGEGGTNDAPVPTGTPAAVLPDPGSRIVRGRRFPARS